MNNQTETTSVYELESFNKCVKIVKSCNSKNKYHEDVCNKLLVNYSKTFGNSSKYLCLYSIYRLKFNMATLY